MATANLNDFLQRLGRGMAAEMLGDQSDCQLVERALTQPDGVALQAIVHRHGAMVYRVCWRVLRHSHDTEDAFQATFLVLAQKLRSVRKRASLASWLHGVAYRVAIHARLEAAARRRRESRASCSHTMPPDDATWQEWRSALDVELSRLPDKWRLPLILCYLEGRTQDEAAGQLGWSKSTLRRRLEEARAVLAQRLSRRGIVLSTALSAVLLSDCSASATPGLIAATVGASLKVATGNGGVVALTPAISALSEGVLRSMFMTKLKTAAAVVVAAVLVVIGIGAVAMSALQARPTAPSDHEAIPGIQPGVALQPAQKKDPNNLITMDTQKAIDSALAYLAREQAEDGSWGAESMQGSVGITSLAGLAFLSGKHHPDRGDHGKVVTKAVRCVLGFEQKDTPGFFHNSKTAPHGPMYGQGFAVLFLADALETITDEGLKMKVKEALTRSVKVMVESQNAQGGWRYQPKPQDADVSVTACQVAALRAAPDAGIEVPNKTIDQATDYIKSCQHPDDGGFRYVHSAGSSGYARTAAALVSLNRLGVKDGAVVDQGMNYLRQANVKDQAAQVHYFYGLYYAAKAVWYTGDKDFQEWYPSIRDELLQSRKDGDRWSQGTITDPHYCTAMALIILQMPHGHLASLRR